MLRDPTAKELAGAREGGEATGPGQHASRRADSRPRFHRRKVGSQSAMADAGFVTGNMKVGNRWLLPAPETGPDAGRSR